jgi:HlyD family secretion protein
VVPTISGRITKLNVDVGSQVKAGDVIAELDKAQLNAQVEQAQAGVDAANVKLQVIQAGARPEAVAAADANVQAAQAKLDAIKSGARTETVGEAKAALDTAKSKLAVIQAGPRPENVASAKANLDAAQAKLQQLLDGPTPDQVAAAKLSVEQSKDSLLSAQTSKDAACRSQGPSCNAAQATADAAETAVTIANQNLKTLTDPPTQDAINQAQAAVDAAQQAYNLAQKPYTDQDLAQAEAAVASAEQAYELAQTPYVSTDVTQAQAAADAAASQAKLAAQPYTDLDLKSAQVAVQQAQAALDIAKTQLAQADILAPFDGVITAKLLSVGALAGPSTPIVTMNSPSLQVQFAIDETKVANVKAGQQVTLTSTAYPGKQFPAKVASVYPSADPKTHTFTVVVNPADSGGLLRAGMFLTLQVTTASFPTATLIPNVAVVQQGSQSVVFTVTNNVAHLVPVTLGISDDSNTQVLGGVNPGDDVVTTNQASLSDGAAVRVAGPTGGAAAGGQQRGSGNSGAGGQKPAATPSPASAG